MPDLRPTLGIFLFLGLLLAGCGDGSPTRPSTWITYTDATIYEEGARPLRILRDGASRNVWRFAPNPLTGSELPEGPEGPTLVELRVTTWPESGASGSDWVTLELETRGLDVPIEPGRYPIGWVPPGDELDPEHHGSFSGTLRIGQGLTGGQSRLARSASGELEVLSVTHQSPPGRRIMLEGSLDAEFREVGSDGEELSSMIRTVIEFRVAYGQII